MVKTLQAEIEDLFRPLEGRVACLAISQGQAEARTLVSINPHEVFPAASLAKVPILVELARRVVYARPRSSAQPRRRRPRQTAPRLDA